MATPRRRNGLYAASASRGPGNNNRVGVADVAAEHSPNRHRIAATGAESEAAQAVKTAGAQRRRPMSIAPALLWRWLALTLLMLAAALYLHAPWRVWLPQRITQDILDAAVLHTLETKGSPSPAAKAYAAVMPSVVRVIGVVGDDEDDKLPDAKDVHPPNKRSILPGPPSPREEKDSSSPDKGKGKEKAKERGKDDKDSEPPKDEDENTVGTGVVIIDNGTILTNMHVVTGARKIKVEFADGLQSDAELIALRPEHDLAVLRAKRIPDDLIPATMRSTADLKPGDRVTAIGFPFGIGPSVSHGVVSGLKRDFRSPKGDRVLSNLIQFDAAANPGNSGGPLVTDDGSVVGIVTAIYNPTSGRFFVGLGFAVPIENAAQAAGMPPF